MSQGEGGGDKIRGTLLNFDTSVTSYFVSVNKTKYKAYVLHLMYG